MSGPRISTLLSLAPHIIGGIIVIIAAGYAGFWLGGREPSRPVAADVPDAATDVSPDAAHRKSGPPQHFYAYLGWDRLPIGDVVLDEARLAEAVGADACIVPAQLPWPGHGPLYADAFAPVRRVLEAAPETDVIVDLRIAPPASWYEENPDARVSDPDNAVEYPSLASEVWRQDVAGALRAAAEWLAVEDLGPRVRGVIIRAGALREWGASYSFDRTEANATAFRAWAGGKMGNNDRIRKEVETAGGVSSLALPETGNTREAFAATVDELYARYASDHLSDALRFLASSARTAFGRDTRVYLPYGYSLGGAEGHGALTRVLDDRNVDGIIAPVSSTDRGVGGAGGFIGPATSAVLRGKEWIHLDDTRTGLERNAEQPAPADSASEQVYHVQRRNFAAALVQGVSYAAADPLGMGALVDTEMWERFGRMRDALHDYVSPIEGDGFGPPPGDLSPLLVVVDDASGVLVPETSPVSNALLRNVRDSVLRCGVPARFCLMQDVLDERTGPAQAYLFLNAFELSEPDRLRLRRIFERDRAAAIWVYAPGIIGAGSAEANVSDIVGMLVREMPSDAKAGSKSALVSPWFEEGSPFGESMPLKPLFYIEDEDASTIATYRDSERVSAAIRFFGEDEQPDWTSVYIAEPALPPGLLREILQITEVHVYVETTDPPLTQTMHLGRGLLAVHADEPGERVFDLGVQCTVEDVLNPARGWPPRRFFTLPMAGGETALFRLIPEEKRDSFASR